MKLNKIFYIWDSSYIDFQEFIKIYELLLTSQNKEEFNGFN